MVLMNLFAGKNWIRRERTCGHFVGKEREVWIEKVALTYIHLVKAMAPHSSTHARKIPWTEEPGRLKSMGSLRVGHDWVTSLSRIGEGNGNPLQYSCLENPRDRGAWWLTSMGSHRVGHDWSDLAAYTLARVKQRASGKLLNNTGSPAWCSVMT